MDKKCAPGNKYENGSCFTIKNLINITISFNKAYPQEKIILKIIYHSIEWPLMLLTLKMLIILI